MGNKIIDAFCDKARERVIFHEEDYKRKKKLKGEEIDFGKMRNAINQRKEIKQLNKIWNKILNHQLQKTFREISQKG